MTSVLERFRKGRVAQGHQLWCVIDCQEPDGIWTCCSDYIEVSLSLGKPITHEDGETTTDMISVSLEQGPGETRPRVWLAHGDVAGPVGADSAEMTIPEAVELIRALMRAVDRAIGAGNDTAVLAAT